MKAVQEATDSARRLPVPMRQDAVVLLPDPEQIDSKVGVKETGKLTENICLCLDIGTTTLALALVSLDEKAVIRTVTSPNPQRSFGADVISRIDYCRKNGVETLHSVITEKVQSMAVQLLAEYGLDFADKMYVSANTTMLHLFFGVDCSSLGVSPYTPVFINEKTLSGQSLGISCVGEITSLDGISAFVGADIVAGIRSVGYPKSGKWNILLDLGTNAEIALFSSKRIVCTAAAAGPCFEGANISCGMTASSGAVCAYSEDNGCTVMGDDKAKGICASGLIDVISCAVRRGDIDETGYLEEDPLPVCDNVSLIGRDVREFQLAKSAIRASIEYLIQHEKLSYSDIDKLYLAGGFSAGLNMENTVYLGLIPEELADKATAVNNSSLSGTVKYVCYPENDVPPIANAEYADMSSDPVFSQLFMDYMEF